MQGIVALLCLLVGTGLGIQVTQLTQQYTMQAPPGSLIINANPIAQASTQQETTQKTTIPLLDAHQLRVYGLSAFDVFCVYKWRLLGVACVVSYGYVLYKLKQMEQAIRQESAWHNWYGSLTLEQLCTLPQEQLAKELLLAIQARYTSSDDFDNFAQPCACFLETVQAEHELLERYCRWVRYSARLRMQRLLFLDYALADSVQERINRLAYLKSVFLTWAAHYKIESHGVSKPLALEPIVRTAPCTA